jgi:hypothetical protein
LIGKPRTTPPLELVIKAVDYKNKQDPNKVTVDGKALAKELLYSQRLTMWLHMICEKPSEELQIAARAQHLCRWMTPRAEYPEGKKGYLKWRTGLKTFHADMVTKMMAKARYSENACAKVRELIEKKNNAKDPQGQILEDAVCLVFLQFEFDPFVDKWQYDDEKVIDIVQKTWAKMSAIGHDHAFKLKMSENQTRLIQLALA